MAVISFPRGIPAASLKRDLLHTLSSQQQEFSAGNTRGLIEATTKRLRLTGGPAFSAGNTRGLIEAHRNDTVDRGNLRVFRGEYPRPH